jgi:hypothetical protein
MSVLIGYPSLTSECWEWAEGQKWNSHGINLPTYADELKMG